MPIEKLHVVCLFSFAQYCHKGIYENLGWGWKEASSQFLKMYAVKVMFDIFIGVVAQRADIKDFYIDSFQMTVSE